MECTLGKAGGEKPLDTLENAERQAKNPESGGQRLDGRDGNDACDVQRPRCASVDLLL